MSNRATASWNVTNSQTHHVSCACTHTSNSAWGNWDWKTKFADEHSWWPLSSVSAAENGQKNHQFINHHSSNKFLGSAKTTFFNLQIEWMVKSWYLLRNDAILQILNEWRSLPMYTEPFFYTLYYFLKWKNQCNGRKLVLYTWYREHYSSWQSAFTFQGGCPIERMGYYYQTTKTS